MTTTTPDRTRREHLLSDVVAGVLATTSFGSSLRHVQTVADSHGQHGLISWTIAISVELVALVAILELRRARGHRRVPIAAVVALAAGLTMSAGANLATATGRGFGWSQVVAVWPAVAYVLVAVIIETRPTASGLSGYTTGDNAAVVSAGDVLDEDTTAEASAAPVDATANQRDSETEVRHDEGAPDGKHPAAARLQAVPAGPSNRAPIATEILTAVLDGTLTQADAAKRAGVSVRTLQRRLDSERDQLRRRDSAVEAGRQ
jgi:hypothetical protein